MKEIHTETVSLFILTDTKHYNMDASEKIAEIFGNVMEISRNLLDNNIAYNSHPNWDSLRHLQLISELEDELGIEYSMDDVQAMKTFKLVTEITLKYLQ